MYDRHHRLHRETVASLPKEFEELLNTAIPYSRQVELMGVEQAPVNLFAPDSKPGRAYRRLFREIESKVLVESPW